jgi:hypothetical protein
MYLRVPASGGAMATGSARSNGSSLAVSAIRARLRAIRE